MKVSLIQMDMKFVVDIIKFGRTLNCIFSSWLDFFNIFDFIFIVFVTDFTYNFFKQVL